jgi:hypothetical protein
MSIGALLCEPARLEVRRTHCFLPRRTPLESNDLKLPTLLRELTEPAEPRELFDRVTPDARP